jgi:hypothetical protein
VARATPRKRSAEAKLKRGAKKARKKVRAAKPPSTSVVETVVVDVIEKPLPGVTVVTEFEATDVREAGAAPEQPEERAGRRPRNQKNHRNRVTSPRRADRPRLVLLASILPYSVQILERVIASLRASELRCAAKVALLRQNG